MTYSFLLFTYLSWFWTHLLYSLFLMVLESEGLSVESCCWTLADACTRRVFLAWLFAVLHCEVNFNGELATISYVTWAENVPPDGLCICKSQQQNINFPFLGDSWTSRWHQFKAWSGQGWLSLLGGDSTLVHKLPCCLPLPIGRCFSSLALHNVQPFEGPGSFLSLPVQDPKPHSLSSWSY